MIIIATLLLKSEKISFINNIFNKKISYERKIIDYRMDCLKFKPKIINDHHYKMDCLVTAYSNAPSENGWGPQTFLGTPLRKGVIAVDPKIIPLHSKIFIAGYGWGVCEDTGGKIHNRHCDVYLSSRAEVSRWGRKKITVIVYPFQKKHK